MQNAETVPNAAHRGTYSPEDNKLRLYPAQRLSPEEYDRVKAAGYKWAPKQGLFVAPMWTPARFDLLESMCGQIEDEDMSLVERAELRAERFEDYSGKRATEAHRAREHVQSISNGIPMGQPILVGHHSQRRAEKDAQKIENGMKKAVQLWDTAKYWESRAQGAISAAKYKEKPQVRARRIKTLGAEMRKFERDKAEAVKLLALWSKENLSHELAVKVAGVSRLYLPRKEGDAPDFDGKPSAYTAITNSSPTLYAPRTLAEVVGHAKAAYPRTIAHCNRWIEHYQNRIAYETAMLNEQGAGALIEKKPRPKQLPICNYDGEVTIKSRYRNPPETYKMHHMTKAEYAAIPSDNRGTWESADGTHRVKVTIIPREGVPRYEWRYGPVFLTDSKVHDVPKPEPKAEEPETAQPVQEPPKTAAPVYREKESDPFADMRSALKDGIQVVSAPQLFTTPPSLAERMAEMADLGAGLRVLEPSAGTGVLLDAVGGEPERVAVEINATLAAALKGKAEAVHHGDFLDITPEELGLFDRVVMNPPFKDASDIKHIEHALQFLKPGGVLVAICAGGSRQAAKLRPLAEENGGDWEPLPAGTFKESGTSVNTVLLRIYK